MKRKSKRVKTRKQRGGGLFGRRSTQQDKELTDYKTRFDNLEKFYTKNAKENEQTDYTLYELLWNMFEYHDPEPHLLDYIDDDITQGNTTMIFDTKRITEKLSDHYTSGKSELGEMIFFSLKGKYDKNSIGQYYNKVNQLAEADWAFQGTLSNRVAKISSTIKSLGSDSLGLIQLEKEKNHLVLVENLIKELHNLNNFHQNFSVDNTEEYLRFIQQKKKEYSKSRKAASRYDTEANISKREVGAKNLAIAILMFCRKYAFSLHVDEWPKAFFTIDSSTIPFNAATFIVEEYATIANTWEQEANKQPVPIIGGGNIKGYNPTTRKFIIDDEEKETFSITETALKEVLERLGQSQKHGTKTTALEMTMDERLRDILNKIS